MGDRWGKRGKKEAGKPRALLAQLYAALTLRPPQKGGKEREKRRKSAKEEERLKKKRRREKAKRHKKIE